LQLLPAKLQRLQLLPLAQLQGLGRLLRAGAGVGARSQRWAQRRRRRRRGLLQLLR
jgi:hypothetical protein